jgi:hypothetical protein
MSDSDAAALDTLLRTPRSKLKPAQVQRTARAILEALDTGQITNMPARDRTFVKSLNDAPRLTDKQIAYVLGDDEGSNPTGGPALRKRYLMALEQTLKEKMAIERGTSKVVKGSGPNIAPRDSGPLTVDEELYQLEKNLDEAWAEFNGDMKKFLAFPGVSEQRDRYLKLTDPTGYVPQKVMYDAVTETLEPSVDDKLYLSAKGKAEAQERIEKLRQVTGSNGYNRAALQSDGLTPFERNPFKR